MNPNILAWARDQAGFTPEEAARRARIGSTKTTSPEKRLLDWEAGKGQPTRTQLQGLARAYRRPLALFFMKKPPKRDERVADFRSGPEHRSGVYSNELAALIRQAQARQDEVRQLLLSEDPTPDSLPFIGRFDTSVSVEALVADLRATLGISSPEQKRTRDASELFRLLRQRAEESGIFVLLEGDLGSHHSSIEPTEFRGLALADEYAPFVIVNSNDSRGARVFTLVHELAHLWLGQSGVGNEIPYGDFSSLGTLEHLCNQVAAELLLPKDDFLEEWASAGLDSAEEMVRRTASRYSVSTTLAANRAWNLGRIDDQTWRDLFQLFGEEWRRSLERRKKKERESEGGPSFYVLQRQRLGNALISLVLGAVASGDLTHTRAMRILRVKPDSFAKLGEVGA